MNISDILIHVNESLNHQQRHSLEDAVREVDGVVAPRFNEGTEHLLLVAFNPAVTNAKALLSKVKSYGHHAQLIGV